MGDRWAIRSPPPPYNVNTDERTARDTTKKTLYVGQPQNLFCRGARFDGISRMKIHPPPPGCEPNEFQSMLMNQSGEILFTPAPPRKSGPKESNKITPDVTAVADIHMA